MLYNHPREQRQIYPLFYFRNDQTLCCLKSVICKYNFCYGIIYILYPKCVFKSIFKTFCTFCTTSLVQSVLFILFFSFCALLICLCLMSIVLMLTLIGYIDHYLFIIKKDIVTCAYPNDLYLSIYLPTDLSIYLPN